MKGRVSLRRSKGGRSEQTQCTARYLQRVAQRKCWLIDNYFKAYKHLKTAEPHVASNVRDIPFRRNVQLNIHLSSNPKMVTTQVVPDSESTCGTAVCVISLNTNLSNLPNRAG